MKFWDACGVAMNLLCTIKTGPIFGYGEPSADDDAEEWPPFGKAGVFDPYIDDPRLGIQRIALDAKTGRLVIGGSAGQIIV